DQQIAMEVAFAGPAKIAERVGSVDPDVLAGFDAEKLKAVFAEKPAVHRYPGSMAGRVQQLAQAVVDEWDGRADAIWTSGSPDGREVLRRLKALPGFGDQKARIFLALLGKQLGFAGDGWREAAGPYGEEGARRSVADIVDRASLLEVRATKQAAKAAAKAAKQKS
ncbi:HhH-GPD-type base excision DNA repair protein, partial [Agrococcus casei]